MKKHFFFSYNLQSEEGKWQQILRVIDASNSMRGVKVTKKDLQEMVDNFNANVLKQKKNELQVNYSHESYAEAAGWITEVRIKGKFLEALIRWTPAAKTKIEEEEFRYFSAEFAPAWQDVESEEAHTNVLLGAALTNIPFVSGMKAVTLSDDGGSEGKFIFFKTDLEMKNFKKLLLALQSKQNVSIGEAELMKLQFATLSEEEQTSLQAEVTKVETLAKENEATSKTEKEELSTKLAEAEKALALAQDGETDQVKKLAKDLKESQATTSELQKGHDKLKLDLRTKDLTEQITELADKGKVLAKDIEATVDMALSQGSEEKQNKFVEFLSNMPQKVDFSEIGSSTAEDASEDAKIAKINKLADEAFATDKSKTLGQHREHFTRELS